LAPKRVPLPAATMMAEVMLKVKSCRLKVEVANLRANLQPKN